MSTDTQDSREVVEIVARAQYAANCWWRPVEDDDDGRGCSDPGTQSLHGERMSEQERERQAGKSARLTRSTDRTDTEAGNEANALSGQIRAALSPTDGAPADPPKVRTPQTPENNNG